MWTRNIELNPLNDWHETNKGEKNGATYYFDNSENQSAQLQLLGLTRSEVIKYSDYCTN